MLAVAGELIAWELDPQAVHTWWLDGDNAEVVVASSDGTHLRLFMRNSQRGWRVVDAEGQMSGMRLSWYFFDLVWDGLYPEPAWWPHWQAAMTAVDAAYDARPVDEVLDIVGERQRRELPPAVLALGDYAIATAAWTAGEPDVAIDWIDRWDMANNWPLLNYILINSRADDGWQIEEERIEQLLQRFGQVSSLHGIRAEMLLESDPSGSVAPHSRRTGRPSR